MCKKYKSSNGITLVALVVTIVVLLILAGISINMLMGENGIIGKASDAKIKTEIADIKEQIQTDIMGEQAGNQGNISDSALKTILGKYGTINYETDETTIKSITTTKGNYEIAMADIWSGTTNNSNTVAVGDGSWNGTVNTPNLLSGMTGVYWDEEGNEVEVIESNKNKWYDYANQKWANAKTEDGSYWVWIPRYEYKISGTTVSIQFVETSKTTVDSEYTYIHPAFRNGSSTNFKNGEWDAEIPGFWVAKYAAGFQKSTTNASGEVINGTDELKLSDKSYTSYNSSYTTNALFQNLSSSNYSNEKLSYPVFKPLTYAYNVISTGDSYTIAQEIDSATDFYGLSSSSADSHMMKNSEWGAVAYLTQSSYGRSGTEVTINSKNLNNSNLKYTYAVTGYGYNSTQGTNIPNNVGASSTNNMTGVFDLNGCVWERVAAYITNGNGNLNAYGSSYASTSANTDGYQTLSTRYATVYPYSSSDSNTNNWTTYKNANYGYGDAVLETSTSGSGSTSWKGDYSYFPSTSYPFFIRGGNFNDGSYAGAFAFNSANGPPDNDSGFRAVLVGA